MYVKKRMSLLLFAALAMVLFTACGRWDFSREAAKAANEAQNAVVFEASATLAQSLKDALEDKVQTADVKAAMEADERLADLLGRLDVYAVEGDDAEAAAQTIADSYIKHISGRKSDGHIAMVKADNGWFYAAIVSYRTGSSSSASDGNGGSTTDPGTTPDPDPEPEDPTPVLQSISVNRKGDKIYWVDETFDTSELTVTATYKKGEETYNESVDIKNCNISSNGYLNSDNQFTQEGTAIIKVTFQDKEATVNVEVIRVFIEVEGPTPPHSNSYYEVGDTFSPVGMKINVYKGKHTVFPREDPIETIVITDENVQDVTYTKDAMDPTTGKFIRETNFHMNVVYRGQWDAFLVIVYNK